MSSANYSRILHFHPNTFNKTDRINLEIMISNVLDSKFKDILDACISPPLRTYLEEHAYFAGGCLRSLIEDKPINDYDIYFDNQEIADRVKAIIKTWTSFEDKFVFKKNIKNLHLSENAYSFSLNGSKIQFITKYSGSPDDLIKKFDFSNSMGWFQPKTRFHDEKMNISIMKSAINSKWLSFNCEAWNPLNSVRRMIKFTSQGYQISNKNLKLLMEAVSKATPEQWKSFTSGDY